MPEESIPNTKNEEKIAPTGETIESPARQTMNSNEHLPTQFKCYSCGKITEYFRQTYEEPIESQTTVVLDRIFQYYIKCNNCGKLNSLEFRARRNLPPTLGKPPNIKEEFYLSLAGEFVKNNTKFVNEVLRQLITLNTALLGGTIAFMNKDVIRQEFKIPIIICLLGGLIIAFKGIFPYSGKISFFNPLRVEIFNKNALEHKLKFIEWSGICSLIAFLLIIIAAIIKMFRP
jgi:transcription elongation factor Elf1